jgi:hypothetical protein
VTILPLLRRELLARARGPALYWMRFAAGLGGMLLCLISLKSMPIPMQWGRFVFDGLVTAAFFLCCCAGFLMADAIAREQREGTFKLLLLTRVTAMDALIGKFGAAGIACCCALTAFAPVLILPVLAGGVTGGEAARKVIVLFDTMFLSLAAGLCASAAGKGWRQSACSAFLLMVLFVAVPVIGSPPLPRGTISICLLSPWSALAVAEDAEYRASAAPYWFSILAIQVISILLLMLGRKRFCRALRRDDEQAARPAVSRAPPMRLHDGEEPMDWIAARQNRLRSVVWAGVAAQFILSGVPMLYPFWRGVLRFNFWGAWFAGSIVQSCLFGWVASRYFIIARQSGELELLLSTPAGADNLIDSQWRWLRRAFQWPVAVLLAPHLLMTAMQFFGRPAIYGPGLSPSYKLFMALWSLTVCAHVVLHVAALLWTGLLFGWLERSQARAVLWTVLLADGGGYFVTIAVTSIFPPIILHPYANSTAIFTWGQFLDPIWFFCLAWWARRQFSTHFKLFAPQSPRRTILNKIPLVLVNTTKHGIVD